MCLIAFAYRAHPSYPLILISNRDESHARPSAALAEWPDAAGVFGGRDLVAGGSWLAVDRSGRAVAVTNYREFPPSAGSRSRGELVKDFITGGMSAAGFAETVRIEHADYGPFNLLCWDGEEMVHSSNRPKPHWTGVEAGIHGLSNGALDLAWPKVTRTKAALEQYVGTIPGGARRASEVPELEGLFAALTDQACPPDSALPDTGAGLTVERVLAPAFICGTDYGTRASSIVVIASDRSALFIERSFGPEGTKLDECFERF